MTSRIKRVVQWLFPPNSLDRRADRKVLLRRVAKALKFRGVFDQYVGSWVLGFIAGLGVTVLSRTSAHPIAADVAEWFYRNATELNAWFAFATIGTGSLLVALHDVVERQWKLRRVIGLPYLRMTGDACLLACGAFTSSLLVVLKAGPITVGQGTNATVIDVASCLGGLAYFMFLALYTTICRVIADSTVDAALFSPVNGRDPGLRRTLVLAGGAGFGTFLLAALVLLAR